MRAYIRHPSYKDTRRVCVVVDDAGQIVPNVIKVTDTFVGFTYEVERVEGADYVTEEIKVPDGITIYVEVDGFLPGEEGFVEPQSVAIRRIRDDPFERPPWVPPEPAELQQRINELEAELFKASWERGVLWYWKRRTKQRLDFTQQWYAERLEPIKDVAKRVGVWGEVAAIIANGSGTRRLADGTVFYDPLTYAQQLNRALGRAEIAEKAAFKASWERMVLLACYDDNEPLRSLRRARTAMLVETKP